MPGVLGSARVYPNPAGTSYFFANLTPGRVYMYKMYTSSGMLLRSGAVQSDEAIDISTLESICLSYDGRCSVARCLSSSLRG